jgi:hypothetical protein
MIWQRELENLIHTSIISMVNHISLTNWWGREREVISLYAFGFLAPRCKAGSILHHPTQIAVEVAVPQIPGVRRKALVCKDLVLWREAYSTCWNKRRQPLHVPMAILEWKTGTDKNSGYDEAWLTEYSERNKDFVGYSVAMIAQGSATRVSVSKAGRGVIEKCWLKYETSQASDHA